MDQNVPVLVPEDTVYLGTRRDNAALLFWRTANVAVTGSQIVQRSYPRPPAFLFQDHFVSVYPVIEAFQQPSFVPANLIGNPLIQYRAAVRLPEPEEDYKRVNHQLFFRVNQVYGLQITFNGYTIEVPDLNDYPWVEYPRPPPQYSLQPFRQIYPSAAVTRGQQFNLYYGQPQPPHLDPEPDTVQRRPAPWYSYGTQAAVTVAKVIYTCGAIDLYDLGNGDIRVAWGPFQGGPPDSYNVYVNGVFNQNVTILEALITGLAQTSYKPGPPNVLVPPSTYTIQVNAVSAGIEVSPSEPRTVTVQPTTIMLVTPMKRIFPFPNSTLE